MLKIILIPALLLLMLASNCGSHGVKLTWQPSPSNDRGVSVYTMFRCTHLICPVFARVALDLKLGWS